MKDNARNQENNLKENNGSKNENTLPSACFPELDAVMKDLPEEQKKRITRVFMRSSITPLQNPIYDKVTSEHITQLLNGFAKGMELDSSNDLRTKIFQCAVLVIVSGVLLTLILVFRNHIQDIKDILIAFISFAGGYGLGRAKKG